MFDQALEYWGNDDFPRYFKRAFKGLTLDEMPLLSCCTHSGVIDKESIEISILSSADNEFSIHLNIGVFFCEVLSGCACSDDPSQAMIFENSYCEIGVSIDRDTAHVSFTN